MGPPTFDRRAFRAKQTCLQIRIRRRGPNPSSCATRIGTSEHLQRSVWLRRVPGTHRYGALARSPSVHLAAVSQGTFDGQKPSTWLPLFYKASKVLLKSVDKDLVFLFGEAEAQTAKKLVAAHADEAAKAVQGTINAHRVVWEKKEQAERDLLVGQAELWAIRPRGHRVTCPACGSAAIVIGDSISAAQRSIEDDVITERQEHLPSRFECIACGMKIAGLSQLTAAGLGDVYMQTQSYDASEYYASPEQETEGWDADNNEPF